MSSLMVLQSHFLSIDKVLWYWEFSELSQLTQTTLIIGNISDKITYNYRYSRTVEIGSILWVKV